MNNRILNAIFLMTLVTLATPALACDQHASNAFESMSARYLAIQSALASDSLDGVAENAKGMATTAGALWESFDNHTAGVDGKHSDACRALMPSVGASGESLSVAENLSDARNAFSVLSESMVAWREMVADPEHKVAYCAMADKRWLQSGGEIANPFYGSTMLRCGEFVAD